MSDTPRTDVLFANASEPERNVDVLPEDIFGLARTIERELSASRAECQRLREALLPFAAVPCEYRGNIHCSMIPADAGVRLCAPCAARAALQVTP